MYLASVKSRLVLPWWYRLARVVPDKEPLNDCVSKFIFLDEIRKLLKHMLTYWWALHAFLQLTVVKITNSQNSPVLAQRVRECVIVSDRSPDNAADILLTGPTTTTNEFKCYGVPQNFADFYFECEIVLQSETADNARYNVSLTFDGDPDQSKPETHVTLDSTSLVARFLSSSLIGNMGKSVFIACF